MQHMEKDTSACLPTMFGLAADLKTPVRKTPDSASRGRQVIFKTFYTPPEYIPIDGAKPLRHLTKELYKNGFEEIIRKGRRDIAPLFSDDKTVSLRSLRLSAGLSQAELAEKTGIQQYQISRYENGKEKPGVQSIEKLLLVLGADITTLWQALGMKNGG